jgi:hypothetical protein
MPHNTDLPSLKEQQLHLHIFTSKLKHALHDLDGPPVITFIDEVSLTTAITLGHVVQRYREVKNPIIGPFTFI